VGKTHTHKTHPSLVGRQGYGEYACKIAGSISPKRCGHLFGLSCGKHVEFA